MDRWKLFYDGGCNLCHSSKLRVERWAEAAGQPLDVEILQSDEAIAKGYQDAMVLETGSKTFEGADAWMRIMHIAPWYLRWLALADLTPPTRWLAKQGYWLVARVRYRIWGRRACPLPSARNP